MTQLRFWHTFLGAIVAMLLGLSANASGQQLVAQSGPTVLDPIADRTHGGLRWSHGAYVYLEFMGRTPDSFHTLDRQGNQISSATLSIPGASHFWTTGYDRGTDGSIVFSGGSYSTEGQEAPFIAWISPDGQSLRVVRTAPYWPFALSIARDGTVWTMGIEMINHSTKVPGINPNAGAVRHFDTTGKLIASLAPQSQFKINRLTQGFIVATQARIGWYSPSLGNGNYVEISTDTMTPHGYPGLTGMPANGEVVEFALTDGGKVFATFEDHTQPHPILNPHRAIYQFDRATSKWVRLQAPAVAGAAEPYLLGSDGDQIVLQGYQSTVFFGVSP